MPSLSDAIYKGITYNDVRKDRQRLAEKWAPFGLLDGLPTAMAKENMAQLLENQAKRLRQEGTILKEANQTTDIIGFQSIALPLVRRVFGGLIANQLVSVQPLSTPAGLIFFLDYKYATAKKGGVNNKDLTSGGSVYGDPLGKSVASTGPYGTGGHYYLNHSYSRYETTGTVKVRASGTVTDYASVDFDPDLSAAWSTSTLMYADVDYSEWSEIENADTTNLKSWVISGTATGQFDQVKGLYQRYNTLTGNVVRFFYSSSKHLLSASSGFKMSYVRKGSIAASASGSAYHPELESDFSTDMIPELDVSITSDYITTDTRKLKVKWTPEMAQDLAAYQNVDAEALLTQILAEHIAMDIDIEILRKLLDAAAATGQAGDRLIRYWSARPNNYVNPKTGAPISGPTLYVTLREWYETLMKDVNSLSNEIQRRTLRTGANFIVASPEICTILEQLTSFSTDFAGDPATTKYAIGFQKAGTLTSRYTVYKSPYMPKQTMLIGYKGDEFGSAGAVFSPYIPLIITPTIFNFQDFSPNVGAMSRYGFKVLNAGYYSLLHVKDLDF